MTGEPVLRVRHTLARDGSLAEPKTAAAVRDVPIPASLGKALTAHRHRAPPERSAEDAFVFTTAMAARPALPQRRPAGARPATMKANLPRLRWHDLRHVAASTMIADGRPVTRYVAHPRARLALDHPRHLRPPVRPLGHCRPAPGGAGARFAGFSREPLPAVCNRRLDGDADLVGSSCDAAPLLLAGRLQAGPVLDHDDATRSCLEGRGFEVSHEDADYIALAAVNGGFLVDVGGNAGQHQLLSEWVGCQREREGVRSVRRRGRQHSLRQGQRGVRVG